MERAATKTFLLTGASGVVGQALVPRLTSVKPICLVHSRPLAVEGIESLQGDILSPRLGLDERAFGELAERIDGVIHSAAITDFTKPREQIFQTNIEGTRNVLALAEAARVPFYYVSTAFVRPVSHSDHEPNSYELSKRQAEALVQDSNVPWVILRPSIVVGDSDTGMTPQFQGLHHITGLALNGILPMIPAVPQSYVDTVPRDFVADAIAAVVQRGETGGEFWLTAGDRALTIEQMVDICTAESERLMGKAIARPKFISQDKFDRLIRPVFMPALPDLIRRMLDKALDMARYMNVSEPFPSSYPQLANDLGMAPLPDPATTFVRNLEYWASVSPYAKGKKS